MDSQLIEYLGYPVFVWQAVLGAVGTLIVAIIVAGFTTFYLRKKDEVTRVAGVILEKRINSAQEILMFLEDASFKLEMKKEVSEPFHALLEEQDFKLPHGHHLQYARVFESVDKFRVFCLTFEQLISKHKLWLGEAVRFHLHLMQAYFSWINACIKGTLPFSDMLRPCPDYPEQFLPVIRTTLLSVAIGVSRCFLMMATGRFTWLGSGKKGTLPFSP